MFADDVEDDPYSTLGLPWGASAESIRRAFRTLARLHHPDRNPGKPQAEARFKLISAAFQRLKAAGWSLPRPSASSTPVADDTDALEPEYHRPQYWPDGSPIYYPTREEIDALLRDAAGPTLLRRLRVIGLWVSKATAYLYAVVIAASVVTFFVVLLLGLLRAC